MRSLSIGPIYTEKKKTKEKRAAATTASQSVIVTDIKSGETKEFVSTRRAAGFININEAHISYIAKSLKNKGTSKGKNYTITKKKIT